ncbi:MAG TPA: urease accessory protein UreE [Oscillatoriaceae cyanobacterium M33_DOE_052]|uniref:Urease accessory protein UreE n=1 Tax=Planktothricoides sp. SpSt-374 TaxID=2282167 RepID=A0A7C3ZZL5_9CYAN|nr:urease accessory protein UreE [Oscillatoriaceae cyanobacterium M33_DOE_052]
MLILTQRLLPDASGTPPQYNLSLTADDRTRSRHRFETEEGEEVYLNLPRGTILQDGDRLASETGEIVVLVTAKPEPILTVTAHTPLDLLRAAYHLGNRHVSLEITPNYLRLSNDSVLKAMLLQLGLQAIEEIAPFYPETGAYHHSHNHE